MNKIKFLKANKIALNGITYKPYTICSLPPKFGKEINTWFNYCVNCSTTEAYGCAPLINHKTGNSIQIMSGSDAARISKLTQRRGYGTMLG